ncbi:MAG TPA: hydrogenase iron-sulfur subunit [Spirochaetia bacterium]|nr:hydrogenase iron-sulfur subunit [Spirochaetia bacterium]
MPAGIGVYLCRCDGRINEVIDLEGLRSKIGKWKGVSEVRVLTALCRPGDLASVVEDIQAGRVDRLVIGACSPAVHQESFERLAAEDLAPNLLERCNLREQCALAHPGDPAGATTQALALLKMGVARLKAAPGPVIPETTTGNRRVLVVGGGIAGLAAAGNLARGGVEVTVVEKRAWLGGRVAQLHRYYPRGCAPRCGLAVQTERLLQSGRVSVHTLAEVAGVHGTAGNFQVNIRQHPRFIGQECTGCGRCEAVCPVVTDTSRGLPAWRKAVLSPAGSVYPLAYAIDRQACLGPACGKCAAVCPAGAVCMEEDEQSFSVNVSAIVMATGSALYDVAAVENYGYGRLPGVLTSMDLEFLASPDGPTGGRLMRPADERPARRVAFIQCAGSRDCKHLPYCSAICCAVTLKQTRYVRDAYPDAEVTVFYMDMRVTGHLEEMYRQAMDEGTVFIRGNPLAVVRAADTGDLEVVAADSLSGRRVLVGADLVVLAAGLVPEHIADSYHLAKDGAGFVPGHLPCSPTEGRRAGIFAAGTAQGPMDASGAVQSGLAASAECLALLDQGPALVLPLLDKTKCDGCKRCVEECPYGAITLDRDGYPLPSATGCRSCGICQGGCPLRCIHLPGFSTREMAARLAAPAVGGEEVRVIAFLCGNDAYRALDGTVYPVNVLPVAVSCAGAVNMGWINDALLNGWDGVIVAGCRADECHYGHGPDLADSRVAKLQETLRSVMVEAERVQVLTCGIGEGGSLAAALENFVRRLTEMGPSPFKEC